MLGSSPLGTFGSGCFGLRGLSPLDPTATPYAIQVELPATELRRHRRPDRPGQQAGSSWVNARAPLEVWKASSMALGDGLLGRQILRQS